MRAWILLLIGASLDLLVAVALLFAGLTLFGAFMAVVAVGGYGLAFVMRSRPL